MIDKNMKSLLLKEVLSRATKKEKQDYEKIKDKKNVASKLVIDLLAKLHELAERDRRNECPKDPAYKCNKSVAEMTRDEFNEYMKQSNSHSHEQFKWMKESIAIVTNHVEIMSEFLDSEIELNNLSYEEKWLLLSFALKSQPNPSKISKIK
jgi:hypothetical protein